MNKELELVDKHILTLLEKLEKYEDPRIEDYQYTVDAIDDLLKVREIIMRQRYIKRYFGASPDTIVKAVTGGIAIIAILLYEKEGIITTKSFDIAKRIMGL